MLGPPPVRWRRSRRASGPVAPALSARRPLDHADVEVEVEKAGPWLLGLGQDPDALDRVLASVGAEPAAVFWCCEGGRAVLYRHLRTLNMAQIPAWR